MPGYGPPQGPGPGGYPGHAARVASQGVVAAGGYPYANSQYGGYGGANSLMPPPGPQYAKGGSAQGSMGSGVPQSPGVPGGARPMYLRQHLQQKMYGGYASPMTPPGGEGASPSPSEGAASSGVPPGSCYSQCPTTTMSELLSFGLHYTNVPSMEALNVYC